jgi:hypothetical protein
LPVDVQETRTLALGRHVVDPASSARRGATLASISPQRGIFRGKSTQVRMLRCLRAKTRWARGWDSIHNQLLGRAASALQSFARKFSPAADRLTQRARTRHFNDRAQPLMARWMTSSTGDSSASGRNGSSGCSR